MKKIVYIIGLMVSALAWNGCGGGGDDGEGTEPGTNTGEEPDEPATEVTAPKVTWTLKSDVAGLDDAGVKAALSHVRMYLYDGEGKLVEVEKCSSADELKERELEAGTYTAVLVGNVPEDENISTETVGTALGEMAVVLTKAAGAAHYAPLGDVMYGKATFTVGEEDMEVSVNVKRTQAATRMTMTDYSGKVGSAGVLVPNVGTRMGFDDAAWEEPGTVFVAMDGGEGRSLSRAEETGRSYTVSVNVAVLPQEGEETPSKVVYNIVAQDEAGSVVMTQTVEVPTEARPNAEVTLDFTVRESSGEEGEFAFEVEDVVVKDEAGETEEVGKDEVAVEASDIDLNLQPGDWEQGGSEDVEFGSDEGYIRPGGTETDWETGGEETVVVDSTSLRTR